MWKQRKDNKKGVGILELTQEMLFEGLQDSKNCLCEYFTEENLCNFYIDIDTCPID